MIFIDNEETKYSDDHPIEKNMQNLHQLFKSKLNYEITTNDINDNDYKINWTEKEIIQFHPADICTELFIDTDTKQKIRTWWINCMYILSWNDRKITFHDKMYIWLNHHVLIFCFVSVSMNNSLQISAGINCIISFSVQFIL